MAYDEGLVAWVQEGLEPLGTVTMRKMMGAATLYLDGIIFAVADDQLWFKSDTESDALWDEAGCERFTFTSKDGRVEVMNYRRAPDAAYDDSDELQRWARVAVAAGQRGAAKKRPRKG
jgi:DNA transformation protein and related proteins